MPYILRKLYKSEFFKNLSIQFFGTLFAQLIPILISPVLSRLYKQDAFAILALFMAIVGVLNVPNAGRYHIAIVQPEDDTEAGNLYQISILTTIIYNLFLLLIISLGYSFFNSLYALNALWFLVPFYVFFFGLYNIGLFYSIRYKQFLKNAKAKISQTLISSIIAILIVFAGYKLYGLVIGRFLGVLVSSLLLFRLFGSKINFSKLKHTARKYIDYPKLTILPTIMNIFSLQALILYVGRFYSEEILGFLGLATMILIAPSALIGMAFRDVFYQKITALYKSSNIAKTKRFFLSSALGLFVIAALLTVILYFGGAFLFGFIYGTEWETSGKYASVLVFATAVKLVVSPLSVVLNTTNRLKWLSLWQIIYFVSLNIILYFSIVIKELSIEEVFIVYAIHEVILYAIYFGIQYYSIHVKRKTN